uniref:G_PROTEIN_RECEP_F1_2 domain-containing protein n=1 Tax=Panagrellus redivivus TaxID=6233 RepID=A0A7E4UX72_PANRE
MNHTSDDDFTTMASTVLATTMAAVESNQTEVGGTSKEEMIEIAMLSICFIIGAPLNLISFYKLYRNCYHTHRPGGKSSNGVAQINLLKLHLNMADLMTLFIYAPAQIAWMITTQWYAGDTLCRIIKFFYTFVFYLTSFVIVCIAVDRVYGAFKLSSVKASKKAYNQCKKLLWAAWMMAMILSLPQLYVFGTMKHPYNPNFEQCVEIKISMQYAHMMARNTTMENRLWVDYQNVEKLQMVHNICHLLFVFWIPALIIVISYVTILCIFNSMSRTRGLLMTFLGVMPCMFTNVVTDKFTLRSSLYSVVFAHGKATNAVVEQHKQDVERSSATSFTNKMDSEENLPTDSVNGGVYNGIQANGAKHSVTTRLLLDETSDVRKVSTMSCIESPKSDRRTSTALSGGKPRPEFRRSHSEQIKSFILSNKNNSSSNNVGTTSARSDRSTAKVGPLAIQTIALARQKTMRQAALILLAYLTLWTPYNVIAIVNVFHPDESSWFQKIIEFSPYLNSLIVANAIVNPLIYGVFD